MWGISITRPSVNSAKFKLIHVCPIALILWDLCECTSSFSKKTLHRFWVSILLNFGKALSIFFSCKIMLMFPSILSINHLVTRTTKIHTRIDCRGTGFFGGGKKIAKMGNLNHQQKSLLGMINQKDFWATTNLTGVHAFFKLLFSCFFHFIFACRAVKLEVSQRLNLTCQISFLFMTTKPR